MGVVLTVVEVDEAVESVVESDSLVSVVVVADELDDCSVKVDSGTVIVDFVILGLKDEAVYEVGDDEGVVVAPKLGVIGIDVVTRTGVAEAVKVGVGSVIKSVVVALVVSMTRFLLRFLTKLNDNSSSATNDDLEVSINGSVVDVILSESETLSLTSE